MTHQEPNHYVNLFRLASGRSGEAGLVTFPTIYEGIFSITCFKMVNLLRVGVMTAPLFCMVVHQNMLPADSLFN